MLLILLALLLIYVHMQTYIYTHTGIFSSRSFTHAAEIQISCKTRIKWDLHIFTPFQIMTHPFTAELTLRIAQHRCHNYLLFLLVLLIFRRILSAITHLSQQVNPLIRSSFCLSVCPSSHPSIRVVLLVLVLVFWDLGVIFLCKTTIFN